MKKLVTLFLAAGMLLTSVGMASAIEFKPSGNINVGGIWYSNLQSFRFMSPADVDNNFGFDNFTPLKSQYRMSYGLNLSIYASEQLSGYLGFGNDKGDAPHVFGDGTFWVTRVTQAYIDWFVPNTPVEVRMGRFSQSAPVFAVGISNPFSGDQDGLRIQAKINDNVSVMGLWFRRNNTADILNQSYGNHTADQFHIQVPVTLDGIKFTPWFNYLRVQEQSTFLTNYVAADKTWSSTDSYLPLKNAMVANTWNEAIVPVAGTQTVAPYVLAGESRVWFAGIGGSITKLTPFTFAFDFSYSSLKATPFVPAPAVNQWIIPSDNDFMNRAGWMLAGSVAYKTDWGTPTLKGWYTTGDDDDISNGSERPIAPNTGSSGIYTFFGSGSDLQLGMNTGVSLAGTWGLSAQWNGASFIDKLTHSLAFSYIRGTNDPTMAPYMPNPVGVSGKITQPAYNNGGNGFNAASYMTKNDSIWALELRNSYKIYTQLTMAFDLFYAWQKFDADTWNMVWDQSYQWTDGGNNYTGDFVPRNSNWTSTEGMEFSNAWGIGLSFRYAF